MTGARKEELGAWGENGEDKAEKQHQCCEVRIENDEYERVAAPCEANKVRGSLKKPPYLRVVRFEDALTFSNSFNVVRTLCLPSHTFHTSLHVHDRLFQKHVPHLLIHTCWFKGHGDVREAYTANTYV